MNQEVVATPATRSWREIPQPVKPRAMSRGGRWRRARHGVRIAALSALGVGLLWGGWSLANGLGRKPRHVPAVARAVPVRHVDLKTSAGGVLDSRWLERTLALPRGAALVELDLERLRARLLEEGQVVTARLTREFPDRLKVNLTERVPVARIRVEFSGVPRDLLVSPDGQVFRGIGFDPVLLETLPWLSGLALLPDGAGFRPITGMAPVAQLLKAAQSSAMHLYQGWLSVSLARLAIDGELEVTTKSGTVVVFNATGDFFVQLATLDYLLDRLAQTPAARARIDLTLGRNVPVLPQSPAAPADGPAGGATASPVGTRLIFSVSPISPSKN